MILDDLLRETRDFSRKISIGERLSHIEVDAILNRGSDQGINYRRGVWHHPMIALDDVCEFLEVHRAGPEANCDEVTLDVSMTVDVADATGGQQ